MNTLLPVAAPAPFRVAVVGAGIAGLTAARTFADGGWDACVFESGTAPGGRMATCRSDWTDAAGAVHAVAFDAGCPAFSARSPAFRVFVEQAEAAGCVARWRPRLAEGSFESLDQATLWVGVPEMPALARHLRQSAARPVELLLRQGVAGLERDEAGWTLRLQGGGRAGPFDALVVALPPAQAAALLAPWRSDWAAAAQRRPMRPCWALMALVDHGGTPPEWDLARPIRGPIATLARNDTKPGRSPAPGGLVPWVVEAAADWSHARLDAAPDSVTAGLQAAAAEWLGGTPAWRHVAVHLWQEASASRADAAPASPFWRDDALALGVCGDHLGGAGVEGAWQSGRALAGAMLGAG